MRPEMRVTKGLFRGCLEVIGAKWRQNPGFCLPQGPEPDREGTPQSLSIFLRTDLGVPERWRERRAAL